MPQYKTMDESNEKDIKIYEVGYLLVPELTEAAVAEAVNEIKTIVLDKLGGGEIGSEMPKMINLAYAMEKRVGAKKDWYEKAHFGWIKFELPTESIAQVKTALEKNNKIIRFLIIKTVRESTIAVKKVFTRPSETTTRKRFQAKQREPAQTMTEEEMDKTIEGLVIE
ncbi:MAG: 30S ribosomal protein S6 [Patescibacteria group bacterium]